MALLLLPPLLLLCAAAAAQSPPSPPSLDREFAVGSLLLTLGVLTGVAVLVYMACFTARAPAERAEPADTPAAIPQIEMRPFAVPVRRVPVA